MHGDQALAILAPSNTTGTGGRARVGQGSQWLMANPASFLNTARFSIGAVHGTQASESKCRGFCEGCVDIREAPYQSRSMGIRGEECPETHQ